MSELHDIQISKEMRKLPRCIGVELGPHAKRGHPQRDSNAELLDRRSGVKFTLTGLYILLALISLFLFSHLFFNGFSKNNYLRIRWTDFRNISTE